MRQTTLILTAVFLAAAPPADAEDGTLRLKHDASNSEMVFTIGPVDLPSAGHGPIKQPPAAAVAIPVSGFLHGFTVHMVDRDGRELPSSLLHHVNIIAPTRRELFSQIMQRVGAAGAETGPVMLPRLLGYAVQQGDSLVFTVMFHNPTDTHYDGAELRIRMKYSKPSPLAPKLAIQPFYLDVMPPAGYHVFTLPPGRSTRSWEGSPAIPGRVLGVGGHMHKYGTALRFEDVTTGKVLWEVKPVTDESGNIVTIPRKFFFRQLGLQLDPKHVYRLTVEYENPTGKSIEDGAMGTLGGVFVPDERAAWPTVDRQHPEYLADLKVTYDRSSSAGGHHHH